MSKYLMLLIDTNDDIVLVTEDSCLRCLQVKCSFTILKNYGIIDNKEVKEFVKLKIKILRAKCECK